jgi:hypothetical protein
MLEKLAKYFECQEIAFSDETLPSDSEEFVTQISNYAEVGGCFGVVCHGEKCFRLLKLKDFDVLGSIIDSSIPPALQRLDVTILREVIMTVGLGIDPGNSEGKIEYTPLIPEAIEKALRGDVQISFILNPTRVDQMREAAEKGYKLPQKSTYFYPKLSSGMVLNIF